LASAQVEIAQLDLARALARARQDLDLAAGQSAILTEQILPAAERSLALARFAYDEGETSLLDLLDTQRTFREMQDEALAARLALALAQVEVQRLAGPNLLSGR